jgi:hypothetical protein
MEPGRIGNSFHFWPDLGTAGIMMPSTIFTDNAISQEITVSAWIRNAHINETPDSGAFMWEFRQWDYVSPDAGARVLAVEASDNNGNFIPSGRITPLSGMPRL